jgi:restriction endonuclease Mrr
MSVPTYDQFIEPVLRFLAEHPEGASAPAAHEAAAHSLNLTEEDKDVLLPSGTQRVYKNRAGWAHDRLKRAGLSSTPMVLIDGERFATLMIEYKVGVNSRAIDIPKIDPDYFDEEST